MSSSVNQELLQRIRTAFVNVGKLSLFEALPNFAQPNLVELPTGTPGTSRFVNNTIYWNPRDLMTPHRAVAVYVHEILHGHFRQEFLRELSDLHRALPALGVDATIDRFALAIARAEAKADLVTYWMTQRTTGYVLGGEFARIIDELYPKTDGTLTADMVVDSFLSDPDSRGFVFQFLSKAGTEVNKWLNPGQTAVTGQPAAGNGLTVAVTEAEAALRNLTRLLVNFDLAHQNRLDPFANTNVPDWVKNAFRIHTPNNPYGPSIQA